VTFSGDCHAGGSLCLSMFVSRRRLLLAPRLKLLGRHRDHAIGVLPSDARAVKAPSLHLTKAYAHLTEASNIRLRAFERATMKNSSNSTPKAIAARAASNAAKTNTKAPKTGPVPVQNPSSIKLPKMRVNPAPVAVGLPSRLQAGPVRMVPNPMNFGDVAGWPAGCCPPMGPGSMGPGFRGK
jgi:hypothetical protein